MDIVRLLAVGANDWFDLPNGARVHRTAIIGLQPMRGIAFARPVHDHPLPVIGARVVIGPHAILYAGCAIGDDTQVCPYAHIREGVTVGQRCVIGVGAKLGYGVQMGNDCQIMDDSHLSGGTIVEDGVFISVQVLSVNDDRPAGYRWKGVTPARINAGAVIGAGARLRPGVTVGAGAIVAMGAVVTRDVAPGATVKGPPARMVATREQTAEYYGVPEALRAEFWRNVRPLDAATLLPKATPTESLIDVADADGSSLLGSGYIR